MSLPVTLIAAVARNGVIGAGNSIPWRLPSDFAQFKRATLGRPLVMGRRTFESIGRPLPGRTNIIVSRQAGYQPDGVLVFNDFDAALDHARSIAAADRADAVMIGGGEAIYRAALPAADYLRLSHVDLEPEGDAHFPEIDPDMWEIVERPEEPRSDRDSASYHVALYRRRRSLER